MSRHQHPSSPPDIAALLHALQRFKVKFVVVGSVASKLHGVDLEPGDLDVVPEMSRDNLVNLVAALEYIEASHSAPHRIGQWQVLEDGEHHWTSREATVEERDRRTAGVPHPADLANLDDLFHTKHGNLDVVPAIAGEYGELMKRSTPVDVSGAGVQVAHIDDLLSALTIPRRSKYIQRVFALRRLQRGGVREQP
jgi:hypothetical protein